MQELPVLTTSSRQARVGQDLARGWSLLLLWGGPVALILAGSSAGELLRLSFATTGILLVIGTGWLGGSCLANAARCGRTHCWIDGTLLPGLAAVGLLNLLGLVRFPWSPFSGAVWLVVLGSFLVECVIGSYPSSRRS